MNLILRAALAAFALGCAFASSHAYAQASSAFIVAPCVTAVGPSAAKNGVPYCSPVTASNPLPISGSFSATLSGFQPTPSFSQLAAADASSHAVAVPTGADDVIQNTSANDAYCTTGATPTATAANILVPAKSSVPLHNGGAFAQIACISPSSTLAVNIAGGSGLWTGGGGGGGGGGTGGGVVTQPTASLLNATVVGTGGAGLATSANQEVTAAGTSATSAQGVQGVTGGVPFTTTAAPDVATNTSVTVQDAGTTCASTPPPAQTQCAGTATAGSFATAAIAGQQGAAAVASLTSGTVATVSFSSEFSWDGGTTWYGRGLFLDSNPAPIWKNGIGNNVFSGSISVPPGATNWRVRAQTLTGTSPNINVKLILSHANSGTYVYNLPTAANGTASVAATAIQGNGTTALPVNTNLQQLSNTALAAPTATGVAPSGGALVQNVNAAITGGSVTATFGQWAPNGNNAQLTVGASSSSVALPAGTVVTIDNTGANTALFRLGIGSATATAADTAVPSGGFKCVTVGSNTFIGAIETAGATTLNINGGSGGCAGAGGGGGGGSGNVFQANIFDQGTASSAATSARINASGSLTIYLVNYAYETDGAASANGTFQIVSGTGTNCSTINQHLTPVWNFAQSGGIQEGSIGVLGASSPGDELCVVTSTTSKVNWRIGAVQQ